MKSAATAATQDTAVPVPRPARATRAWRRAAGAVLVIGAALVAGCETLRERFPSGHDVAEPRTAGQARSEELAGLRSWSLLGTLAVRPARGDASRVTVRWRQSPDSYLVRFMGPLGVGLFEVEGSATATEARFPDGRRSSAGSPEALLEREIGWSVPLRGLRYWIVGAPVPGTTPAMEVDDRGRVARLEQAGWTVIYESWGGTGSLALPERIRFSNDSVDATFVVRRWKVEGGA